MTASIFETFTKITESLATNQVLLYHSDITMI